ncbi:MAG TPA: hypothetical protein VF283_14310 [Bryobacteraceae bacterium]
MESGPSKIAEALVYWLLPPACREEVLGDMRERNVSSACYLVEAISTVPSIIYSRIRRTTDAVVTLMAAASMYTAFVMSAWWLDRELLFREYGYARVAIPPLVFVVAIILADAYSDPKKRWPLKPLFGPTLGLALTYAVELNHRWALPASVLACGAGVSVLLVSTLRLLFPPVTERPQTAKFPAFWQKLELAPLSFRLKGAVLPCAALLAVIVYLLISRG